MLVNTIFGQCNLVLPDLLLRKNQNEHFFNAKKNSVQDWSSSELHKYSILTLINNSSTVGGSFWAEVEVTNVHLHYVLQDLLLSIICLHSYRIYIYLNRLFHQEEERVNDDVTRVGISVRSGTGTFGFSGIGRFFFFS